ncbi:hypothetical protein IE4872_PD00179 (plasmid) [Rhizobium gallicum]|uniref:Uncharacterized protein n=1 Tax=Rhizobium gallicum TaxID=56730 RepID=A0A1L5NS45_9HYPH|nr:hypothetical protein [Rhizobium gallicum]APO70720.1 hypothetical protein IE4872_PD00179 [Rhizobium gallicum]
MDRFPTIKFLLKNSAWLPPLAGLVFPIIGVWLGIRTGLLEIIVIGLLLGPIVYLVVRSYIELVTVMAEYLLPQ